MDNPTASGDTAAKALQIVQQAIALTRDTFKALADGDSEKANQLATERQQCLNGLALQELPEQSSPQLRDAFEQLQAENNKLIETSEQVQKTIGDKLNTLQKGITNTQAYQDISRNT